MKASVAQAGSPRHGALSRRNERVSCDSLLPLHGRCERRQSGGLEDGIIIQYEQMRELIARARPRLLFGCSQSTAAAQILCRCKIVCGRRRALHDLPYVCTRRVVAYKDTLGAHDRPKEPLDLARASIGRNHSSNARWLGWVHVGAENAMR